jgi:hypothetical protein
MKLSGFGKRIKGKKGNEFDILDNDMPKGCIRPYINMPRNILDNDILI